MDGKEVSTPAFDELKIFSQRNKNVEIRTTQSVSGFQGRSVISVTKEGVKSASARGLEEKLRGSKDFYPVRYGTADKEPGLLTAALLLLDSGREDLMRQRQYFSEIPAALRSEIRQLLDNYVYIARSA